MEAVPGKSLDELEAETIQLASECATLNQAALQSRFAVLQEGLTHFFENHQITCWSRWRINEEEEAEIQYLETSDLDRNLFTDLVVDLPRGMNIHSLKAIADRMAYIKSIVALRERVGYLDQEAVKKRRERYGAKAANLEELERVVNEFGKQGWEGVVDYPPQVLPFIAVAHDESWESVNGRIRGLNADALIMRSSAVHSEDGERSLAPGIYESVVVNEGRNKTACKAAFRIVKASLNLQRATDYRRQEGIPEENMGCVIQAFCDGTTKGHINTIMPGRPELMEIVVEEGSQEDFRAIMVREKLDSNDPYFFQIDRDMVMSTRDRNIPYEDLAGIMMVLEAYFECPIQVEYILVDNFWIYLVQVRPLPKNFQNKIDIQFPQKKAIWEGAGLGPCDTTLPVLSIDEDNREREGVVIFSLSWKGSTDQNSILRALPQKGVVVVASRSKALKGHIETLCAQRGISVFFKEGKRGDQGVLMEHFREGFHERMVTQFEGHTTLHCVCDGLRSAVYKPDEQS